MEKKTSPSSRQFKEDNHVTAVTVDTSKPNVSCNLETPSPISRSTEENISNEASTGKAIEEDDDEINELLTVHNYTDDWSLQKLTDKKYTKYAFWYKVINTIEEHEKLTFKNNLKLAMENLDFNCKNLSVFVRKIKGIHDKIEKKNDLSLNQTIVIKSEINQVDLSPEIKQLRITLDFLNNPTPIDIEHNKITKKIVMELKKFQKRNNMTDDRFAEWIFFLFKLKTKPHPGTLRLQLERIFNKRKNIKTPENLNAYLDGKYDPPKKLDICQCFEFQEQKSGKTDTKLKTDKEKRNVSSLNEKILDLKKQNRVARGKIYQISRERGKTEQKYELCREKLNNLSVRNVNKRFKRKDQKIKSLLSENESLRKTIVKETEIAKNIKKKYKNQQSLLRYYKKTRANTENIRNAEPSSDKTDNKNTDLNDTIYFLENENLELKEKLSEAKTNTENIEIQTFHDGKYNNTVREVYTTLLSLNVGVKNVESVIRTVLGKLTNVNIGRLPKKTLSELLMVEAKALAQIQGAEAIIESENCTLHTDGTKRAGREYGGLQVGTSSGQYSLGLMEIAKGDTECFLNMIKNMFDDLSKLIECENVEKKNAELLSKIKNMMTDRHIVNESLKKQIEIWKSECLPLVIENFNDFPDDVKLKLVEINHFKCNLHVLVNLATQAETALKQWEKSVSVVVPSQNLDTSMSFNTPDFIRATCKLCVPGADQKSGYGLLFLTYLESLENPVKLKLTSFHGHRINILFSMAASVYFHKNHIKDFIDKYFSDKTNRLVSCVAFYTCSDVHIAGCRALGIIDKLLTGPLWRQIEAVENILDLNDIWFVFLNNLERFSQDASELLQGDPIFPNFTKKDDVFTFLFDKTSDDLDVLTLEALQILCTNFLIIIHRQLGDNLPGGKFTRSSSSSNNFDQLKIEAKTVSTTNIISERDFANLDRLKREKPNANVTALEGMILFTNNQTLKWLDQMDDEKKEKVFETARKFAPKMVENYRTRKAELKSKHIENLKKREEDKLNAERKKNEEILKINNEIQKYGGLWTSHEIVKSYLKTLSKSDKIDAIKWQIKYRKVILKQMPSDKSLIQFSSQNRQFTVDELTENLLALIDCLEEPIYRSDDDENMNCPVLKIKSKEERDIFMTEHRLSILEKIKQIKLKQSKINQNLTLQKEVNQDDQTATPSEPKKRRMSEKAVSSNEEAFKFNAYKVGQMVAVAYSDSWYPGQVLKILKDNFAEVKFLHPLNSKCESFRWPQKDDISEVENIFVFFADFDIQTKDSKGRTWIIPTVNAIKSLYLKYKEQYFS